MVQSMSRLSPLLICLVAAVAGPLHAAQPPDVVQSDSSGNTAMGTQALYFNTTGTFNTASGAGALFRNTTGPFNTAAGVNALSANTDGYGNTATGANALLSNSTGSFNTAAGTGALDQNSTGSSNTASGYAALEANTNGNYNTANGFYSMLYNSTGSGNAALGSYALFANTTGSNNTALGANSLYFNSSGSGNIAVGTNAGSNLTTGNNNIDIGNLGVAGENGTIRIGARGPQTKAFVAGIWGSPVTGSAVYVNGYGQLGVMVSAERYKTDIATMASSTAKLDQLRPVTFRLKNEPQGALQYGLIAEEVEKVYPELVIRNEDGSIQGVRYEELSPMLLNVVQQQQRALTAQAERLAAQEERMAAQARQLEALQTHLSEVMELEQSVRASLVKLQEGTGRADKL